MRKIGSLLAAATTCLNSCLPLTSFTPVSGTSDFQVDENVLFTPEHWPSKQVADFYKPIATKPTPAILLIHGGGWNDRERRGDMVGIAKSLAKNGYLVMNATYRLTPDWKFPTQVEDINQALKYLRKNAESLNIDPHKIGTFGYSAGGHLALLAGLDPENQIKAIVTGGAPSDLSLWPDGRLTGLLLGGPLKGNEELYQQASPVAHIRPASPPVFIYHGTSDSLVPPEHPKALISELKNNHVAHEAYWIGGRSHITAHIFPARAIHEAIRFLDEQLKSPLQ